MPFGTTSEAIVGARVRAEARRDVAIADLLLPVDGRLDDRDRAALRDGLAGLLTAIETDLRRHAGRLLAARNEADAAAAIVAGEGAGWTMLIEQRRLADREVLVEAIAATRLATIGAALPVAPGVAGRASLLARLSDLPDRTVAQAARALMAAESETDRAIVLTAEPFARLVWLTAAAVGSAAPKGFAVEQAIVDAARRIALSHDDGERPIVAAHRLVTAIEPLPGEVPVLAADALADRRVSLFVAVLAHALRIEGDVAAEIVTEPDDSRLPLALRAIGMGREQIARAALSLAEADPHRDIEAFADAIDAIDALTPQAAATLVAPLALPRAYRDAARKLERRR